MVLFRYSRVVEAEPPEEEEGRELELELG